MKHGTSKESYSVARLSGGQDVGGANVTGVYGDSPMREKVGVARDVQAVETDPARGRNCRREITITATHIVSRAIGGGCRSPLHLILRQRTHHQHERNTQNPHYASDFVAFACERSDWKPAKKHSHRFFSQRTT